MLLRHALAAALLSLALAPAAVAQGTKATLTGYDVLSRHGRQVELRAKLERTGVMGIHPDVAGESLDCYLVEQDGEELDEARYLGSGETDDDGVAAVRWKPATPGQYLVEARVRRRSDYVALPARILVAVPAADRPVLLVQLDGTASKATNVQLFRGTENAKIEAVEGAAAVLAELSQRYQLAYLTDLEVAFTGKFKDWLELRELPPAPVIFWELFERSLSHTTYMDRLVGRLRKLLPQTTIGIGGAADGQAFVRHGLSAIAVGAGSGQVEATVLRAEGWQDVPARVRGVERAEELLREMAQGGSETEAALQELLLYGPDGIAAVHRFRSETDVALASAAALVAARLEANRAFLEALDLSSANAALSSLIAAWRYGERGVVARLYADLQAGTAAPLPSFRRVEVVTRNEPEPDKVVFRLRLLGDDAAEHELVFVRQDDKLWRLDVQDF